ncbi:hypothetical protein F4821DRAFT_242987 [Hypoxylon rubiginosum]|uniref:Uncharacterized protein n=1 Tax=Hypoxylon rubiginosum TaxID=110542 RepID=A0ACC0CVB2_9PEZI|nr:hypothetical protein F4821DRAFT_242987 [Hypoxylon rubiginosum]
MPRRLERNIPHYQDREPRIERDHYSSPIISTHDYMSSPVAPQSTPLYVPPIPPRAPFAAYASVFAAAEPAANEKPTEDIKMREKLLSFLYPYSPDLVHQNLARARVKDSGAWLFTLPAFEKWRETNVAEDTYVTEESRANCLWLSGNLGAGKTMLM